MSRNQLIVNAIKQYMADNKVTTHGLAKMLNCSPSTVYTWTNGKYAPRGKLLKLLVKKGVLSGVSTREAVQSEAVTKALVNIDEGNKVPRTYKRRIAMPTLVTNQLKLILEDYIGALGEPRTYAEFNELRDETINKLYYTCKQGG